MTEKKINKFINQTIDSYARQIIKAAEHAMVHGSSSIKIEWNQKKQKVDIKCIKPKIVSEKI